MKLRNKKTGDIWEFDGGFSMKASQETAERAGARSCSLLCFADSIAELNEEWEDIEPLIKDEKIVKTVRAWADMNDIRFIHITLGNNKKNVILVGKTAEGKNFTLEIANGYRFISCIKDYKDFYTIAELCGEEEE